MKTIISTLSLLLLTTFAFAQVSITEHIDPKQKLVLKGVVKDNTTKKGVYDATVILTGTNGTMTTVKTNKKGKYEFSQNKKTGEKYLVPDEEFSVVIKKEGYQEVTYTESTGGIYDNEVFENNVFLEPK